MLYDSSGEVEAIWKVQLKIIGASLEKSAGLQSEHEASIKHLDQRTWDISLSLISIIFIAIIFTASSPYVIYGFLMRSFLYSGPVLLSPLSWPSLKS